MSRRPVDPGVLALALALALAGPATARALGSRTEGPTPPRLAAAHGVVSFWRTGAEDWAPAQVNTPLAAGDRLYANGAESSFEIELASRAVVRGGADTEIAVASLETGYLQLEVTSGYAALDFQRLPDGQRVEIDTPNGVFLIDRAGYYRVDVVQETRFVVRRGGEAYVIPAGGQETPLGDGQQIVLTGTDPAQVATSAAPAPDAFDQWNDSRLAGLPAQPRSQQHVAAAVAGVDDLDRYGEWRQTAEYGQVWVPQDVGPDWAPYTTGRWTYDPYYEWSWVDDAPWGWAPYHYGRWVNTGGYWGWAPPVAVASPVYAPALVGFYGGGGYGWGGGYGGYGYGGGVGVSVNIASPIGWVALGFGEPCLPWWGPAGFRGRPWWGGWGGPRYVNNVYIDNRRIVNVNDIDGWRNGRYRNAVSGVRGDRFGRGRGDRLRFGEDELRRMRPLRDLRVRPDRASLVARDGRGQRPPDRIRNRAVMATRARDDSARRLRAAGIDARDDRPRPRLVGARGDDRGRGVRRAAADTPPLPGNRRRPQGDDDTRRAGLDRRGEPGAPRAERPGRDDRGRRNAFAADAPRSAADRRAARERARTSAPPAARVADAERTGRRRDDGGRRPAGRDPRGDQRTALRRDGRDDAAARRAGDATSGDRSAPARRPRDDRFAATAPPSRGGRDDVRAPRARQQDAARDRSRAQRERIEQTLRQPPRQGGRQIGRQDERQEPPRARAPQPERPPRAQRQAPRAERQARVERPATRPAPERRSAPQYRAEPERRAMRAPRDDDRRRQAPRAQRPVQQPRRETAPPRAAMRQAPRMQPQPRAQPPRMQQPRAAQPRPQSAARPAAPRGGDGGGRRGGGGGGGRRDRDA